jgi:2-(1,2-epoxy-1,2-dihydrophenyl)acetyl-CoA isomerase
VTGKIAENRQPDEVLQADMDGAFVLTLNAPEYRNACSPEMRIELLQRLREATEASRCKVIILTGAGDHFCSGGRLPEGQAPDPERTRRNGAYLHDIARILHAGPKPSIAAVEGVAYGAGFAMAMACDYVVAGEGARMCASFGKVGLVADTGIAWTLPQRVGGAAARDLLLTGREVRGPEMQAAGLADELVAPGQALAAALVAARRYDSTAPLSLAATKHMLASCHSLEAVLAMEAEEQPRLTMTQDYAEGRAALRERRKPVFRGL